MTPFRHQRRFLLGLLALVTGIFPALLNASTYYVDFAAGSDSSDGASVNTPWQHCPGDALATGNPRSVVLMPGDTVIFKGGVEYQSSITVYQSGTQSSPLTFDGNSAGTFGSGRAVLSGGNVDSNSRRFGFILNTRYLQVYTISNIVINGFVFTRFGGHGTDNPANIAWTCANKPSTVNGYGVQLGQCDGITISSCLFTNIGDWTNAPNMDAGFSSGFGIDLLGHGSNITITNNEFTMIGSTAIRLSAQQPGDFTTNIFIGNNNIHDYIQWGINVVPGAGATSAIVNSIYITNNAIHDMWQYSPNQYLGCAGDWPHTDGIFCFLGYSPASVYGATLGTIASPLVIANNSFYCNQSYTNQGGTANIYLSGYGGRVLIYNNTFANVLNMGEGAVFILGAFDLAGNKDTPIDYEIYNNSFYDQTFGIVMQSQNQKCALTNGTVKVANNVFYHSTVSNFALPVVFGSDGWSSPTMLDYNRYFTIRVDGCISTSWNGSAQAYNTFGLLRALGFEGHGSYGDPKYSSTAFGLGTHASLNDLHLQTNSPLIGAGLNLSNIFTSDKDGRPRPASGNWDIGAFQYSTNSVTASRPPPPSGLRVLAAGP